MSEERFQIEPQRLPLRSAMEGDIYALRDFLTKMNGRLVQELSPVAGGRLKGCAFSVGPLPHSQLRASLGAIFAREFLVPSASP